MEQEQLTGKKFNPPGGKRYLQPLSVSTRGVGWIPLCSGHPKHPKGIYCAGEQQNLLKEFRPENTIKEGKEAGEKGDGVKVASGGARVVAAAPPNTKDVSRAEIGEQVLKYRQRERETDRSLRKEKTGGTRLSSTQCPCVGVGTRCSFRLFSTQTFP